TLQDYKHFFHCADQLTQTYAVPDQKVIYFLITDSEALRNEAVQKLEHVIISGLPIKSHPDHDHADDVNNAVIENWILSKTDYRVCIYFILITDKILIVINQLLFNFGR